MIVWSAANSAIPWTGGNPKHMTSVTAFNRALILTDSAIPWTGGNPKRPVAGAEVPLREWILPSLGRGAIPNASVTCPSRNSILPSLGRGAIPNCEPIVVTVLLAYSAIPFGRGAIPNKTARSDMSAPSLQFLPSLGRGAILNHLGRCPPAATRGRFCHPLDGGQSQTFPEGSQPPVLFCHPLDGGQSQTTTSKGTGVSEFCHPLDWGNPKLQHSGVCWRFYSAIPWTGGNPKQIQCTVTEPGLAIFCHPSDWEQSQTRVACDALTAWILPSLGRGAIPNPAPSTTLAATQFCHPSDGGNPKQDLP